MTNVILSVLVIVFQKSHLLEFSCVGVHLISAHEPQFPQAVHRDLFFFLLCVLTVIFTIYRIAMTWILFTCNDGHDDEDDGHDDEDDGVSVEDNDDEGEEEEDMHVDNDTQEDDGKAENARCNM